MCLFVFFSSIHSSIFSYDHFLNHLYTNLFSRSNIHFIPTDFLACFYNWILSHLILFSSKTLVAYYQSFCCFSVAFSHSIPDLCIFSPPSLLQLKVALTEECYGGEQALNVCQEMLQLWNEAYAEDLREYALFTLHIYTASMLSYM